MGHDYTTLEFWTVMTVFGVYGGLRYNEGYEDATDLAEASWTHAKKLLEDAIAREDKVQQMIKEFKEEQQ
jgi:hypothetical protein